MAGALTPGYPAPESPRRLPLSAADLLLILIAGLGLNRLLLPLVAEALGVDPTTGLAGNLGAVLLLLLVQFALLFAVVYGVARRWRGVQWAELGFVPLPPGWGRRAVLIALGCLPLVGAISWAQQQITGQPFENPQFEAIAPPDFAWSAYLATLVTVAALAPLVEEVLFRGLLFRWLGERFGLVPGVGGSALAFALLHGIPGLIPGILVLGALLALVYHRAGSIWAPILVHGTYNALVTTALYIAIAQGLTPPGG